MDRPRLRRWWRVFALFAILATACAPAVPDLSSASNPGAASEVATTSIPTTTAARQSATTSTTRSPTTSTSNAPTTTTTTLIDPAPETVTVGDWTATGVVRDASGEQFKATLSVPVLTTNGDSAVQARVATLVDGHVESQVGSTLALWRSIEGQGQRDMTGSALNLQFEIAGFEEGFVSLRFFASEQVAGSSGTKNSVTTLMVDLATGVAIGLDDVIFGGDSRSALLTMVSDSLLADYFDGDETTFGLWAGDLQTGDLDRALLTKSGLEIWFNELEVGPPEMGVPVVTIGYSGLREVLDPIGPARIFNPAF